MADFAPYQDAPESTRALSPPAVSSPRIASPRTSLDRTRNIGTASVSSPSHQNFQHGYFGGQQDPERTAWSAVPGGSGRDIDMFETRLGLRMDYEACLAYLLLPPAGGVLLLMFEHRSDYVRWVFEKHRLAVILYWHARLTFSYP